MLHALTLVFLPKIVVNCNVDGAVNTECVANVCSWLAEHGRILVSWGGHCIRPGQILLKLRHNYQKLVIAAKLQTDIITSVNLYPLDAVVGLPCPSISFRALTATEQVYVCRKSFILVCIRGHGHSWKGISVGLAPLTSPLLVE